MIQKVCFANEASRVRMGLAAFVVLAGWCASAQAVAPDAVHLSGVSKSVKAGHRFTIKVAADIPPGGIVAVVLDPKHCLATIAAEIKREQTSKTAGTPAESYFGSGLNKTDIANHSSFHGQHYVDTLAAHAGTNRGRRFVCAYLYDKQTPPAPLIRDFGHALAIYNVTR